MTYLEYMKKYSEMLGKEFLYYCGDDTQNKYYKYNLHLCKIVGGGRDCGIEWFWEIEFKDGKRGTVSSLYLRNFKIKNNLK